MRHLRRSGRAPTSCSSEWCADGENFWTAVYEPFMARDITRDDLRALVRQGLGVDARQLQIGGAVVQSAAKRLQAPAELHTQVPVSSSRSGFSSAARAAARVRTQTRDGRESLVNSPGRTQWICSQISSRYLTERPPLVAGLKRQDLAALRMVVICIASPMLAGASLSFTDSTAPCSVTIISKAATP